MPTSQPNYLTVAADGTVSADFSGHISAAGVDLAVGASLNPDAADPDHRVRWHEGLDPKSGGLVAELLAGGDAVGGNFWSYAEGTDVAVANHGAAAAMKSTDPNYGQRSFAQIQAIAYRTNYPAPPYISRLMAVAGAKSRTLLQHNADGTTRSGFMQLLNDADIKAAFGWAGAQFNTAQLSVDVVVNHGLGITPQIVLCTAAGTAPGIYSPCHIAIKEGSAGPVSFTANGGTMAGEVINRNVPFYWLAIG